MPRRWASRTAKASGSYHGSGAAPCRPVSQRDHGSSGESYRASHSVRTWKKTALMPASLRRSSIRSSSACCSAGAAALGQSRLKTVAIHAPRNSCFGGCAAWARASGAGQGRAQGEDQRQAHGSGHRPEDARHGHRPGLAGQAGGVRRAGGLRRGRTGRVRGPGQGPPTAPSRRARRPDRARRSAARPSRRVSSRATRPSIRVSNRPTRVSSRSMRPSRRVSNRPTRASASGRPGSPAGRCPGAQVGAQVSLHPAHHYGEGHHHARAKEDVGEPVHAA